MLTDIKQQNIQHVRLYSPPILAKMPFNDVAILTCREKVVLSFEVDHPKGQDLFFVVLEATHHLASYHIKQL